MADQHAGVHGGRRKRREIIGKRDLAERQPGRARTQVVAQELDLAGQRRRDREAAMADDLGGDALSHLRVRRRIDRQREVRMGLDVDEPGTDHEPSGIDRLPRRARQGRADRRDAAAYNGEVGGPPGRPAAVEYRAAADQDVRGHGAESSCQAGLRLHSIPNSAGASSWRTMNMRSIGQSQYLAFLRGRLEARPHGFVGPPSAVTRHARPTQRFGLGEDETTTERRWALGQQEALHPFGSEKPWPREEASGMLGPRRRVTQIPAPA